MQTGISFSLWPWLFVGGFLWSCFPRPLMKPDHYAVLPGEAAYALTKQCSRVGAPAFEDTWQPGEEDIRAMERHFGKLQRMRSKICCLSKARMDDINLYFRQYVGIVVQGRRLIYINAFRADHVGRLTRYDPQITCDGGNNYWGVVYDPKTGRFFDLSFNGIS